MGRETARTRGGGGRGGAPRFARLIRAVSVIRVISESACGVWCGLRSGAGVGGAPRACAATRSVRTAGRIFRPVRAPPCPVCARLIRVISMIRVISEAFSAPCAHLLARTADRVLCPVCAPDRVRRLRCAETETGSAHCGLVRPAAVPRGAARFEASRGWARRPRSKSQKDQERENDSDKGRITARIMTTVLRSCGAARGGKKSRTCR